MGVWTGPVDDAASVKEQKRDGDFRRVKPDYSNHTHTQTHTDCNLVADVGTCTAGDLHTITDASRLINPSFARPHHAD